MSDTTTNTHVPSTPNSTLPDEFLTLSEAASLIGVSVDAVRHYTSQGKLPSIVDERINRRLVLRSDVEKFEKPVPKFGGRLFPKPTAPEGYMTTKEVADFLGVTHTQINVWRKRGLFDKADLLREKEGIRPTNRLSWFFRTEAVKNFTPPIIQQRSLPPIQESPAGFSSYKEVGEMLGIQDATAMAYLIRGVLTPYTINGQVFAQTSDIVRLLNERTSN